MSGQVFFFLFTFFEYLVWLNFGDFSENNKTFCLTVEADSKQTFNCRA